MTRDESLWLAGLLEGEGCFRCAQSAANMAKGFRPSLRIQLKMTDRDVVQRAQEIMQSCGLYRVSAGAPRRDAWVTYANGRCAEDTMRAVRPFMGARRGAKIDALLALDLSHHPRPKGWRRATRRM